MRTQYRRNKIKTSLDIIRRIDNWPSAIDMRLRRQRRGLRLLNFREGLSVVCRGGSRDWDVIHELLFAGSYAHAMGRIKTARHSPTVIDLGGNIGLFSLLTATQRHDITVHAFEPGPPNYRLFEMNLLANPVLAERIHLHREAVGGASATVNWFFDENNPGGSSLYGTSGKSFPVTIRAFTDVVASIGGEIDLAKIDIEGAEFDLIRNTPPLLWEKISAISLELHDDPAGQMTQPQFLERMNSFGYSIEEESVCTYFLERR
jgi:FkbM family methyltransferase